LSSSLRRWFFSRELTEDPDNDDPDFSMSLSSLPLVNKDTPALRAVVDLYGQSLTHERVNIAYWTVHI
jgi:hypothetical protein